jgi:hypothetical protein
MPWAKKVLMAHPHRRELKVRSLHKRYGQAKCLSAGGPGWSVMLFSEIIQVSSDANLRRADTGLHVGRCFYVGINGEFVGDRFTHRRLGALAEFRAEPTLTRPGACGGPWSIATGSKTGKFENCTMSRSAGHLGITFVRGQDGLSMLLTSSKWKLDRGVSYPVRLVAGSLSVKAQALVERRSLCFPWRIGEPAFGKMIVGLRCFSCRLRCCPTAVFFHRTEKQKATEMLSYVRYYLYYGCVKKKGST